MAQGPSDGATEQAVAVVRRPGTLGALWVTPAIGVPAGVLLGSCVVSAGAVLFALSAFHDRMERDAPHRPIAAAVRCVIAGAGSMAGAVVLVALTTAAALDWWGASSRHPVLSLAALLGLYVISLLHAPVHSIGRGCALALGGATIAVSTSLPAAAECVYAGAAVLVLLRAGWLLVHDMASELLRQAR